MITVSNANSATKKLIKELYKEALNYFEISEDFDLSVTFVGVARMRELNKEYRHMDKATDVLTFPNIEISLPFDRERHLHEINPENNRFFLGDILISLKIARDQAKEYNHSVTREIAFLTLHGILHLFGFDHASTEEEDIMTKHQENILNNLGVLR